MGFVVTKNESRGFKASGFTRAVATNVGAFYAIIETIEERDIGRDDHTSKTINNHRVDMTNPTSERGLIQMQSGHATYASATYDREMESFIVKNLPAFKAALKEVLRVCQETACNTIITWGAPPPPPPKKK